MNDIFFIQYLLKGMFQIMLKEEKKEKIQFILSFFL